MILFSHSAKKFRGKHIKPCKKTTILMYDFLFDSEQLNWIDHAKKFAKKIPRQLLIDMDLDNIQYPQEFVRDLAKEGLLGLRFPKIYGGQEQSWITEMAVLKEIGVLSMALGCLYSLPSICGEALNKFGTEIQKVDYLKPILTGKKFCAEALTEPRGGSDFFGATTTAIKEGENYVFMDDENYEQYSLMPETVGESVSKFLKEEQKLILFFVEGNPVNVTFKQTKMPFTVTEAEPGIKGDTANNSNRPVTIETGAQIAVPLFINQGDTILVNVETEEYCERVK